MVKKGSKIKPRYKKRFAKGLMSTLAKEFTMPRDQLTGFISGSRPISARFEAGRKNAEMLTLKFKTIGINVPIEYWYGDSRSKLRILVANWYKKRMKGSNK